MFEAAGGTFFHVTLCYFGTQEAHAMQEKVSAQYKNEIYMAKAQRDYELKKAAYDLEVNTKKAESEMAYQLQVLTSSKPAMRLRLRVDLKAELNQPKSCPRRPGSKDQAAHRGGENAGAGGGADAADHAAGAGDHPQGEGAGGQGDEACRGREVPAGEASGG